MPLPEAAARQAMTVSDLTRQIKALLETEIDRVWVEGEISNFKRQGSSGHWYFSLKDEGASISAVMFRNKNRWLKGFEAGDGQRVIVIGRVSVYPPRGSYQIVVERMEPVGLGRLQAELEQRKAKLASEGLFDTERKKPLPFLPTRIGIVTSKTGAALRDILQVLARRRPHSHITICPVRVQGPGAASQVATAIRTLSQAGEVDVIIVARGGGSLEDLWAFNEEVVVRSIAAARLPVVSAVGHETDYTLADFAADVRAPTPSAAAEIVVRVPEQQLRESTRSQQERLRKAMARVLARRGDQVDGLRTRLRDPRRILQDFRLRVDELVDRGGRAQIARVSQAQRRAEGLERTLRAHGPLAELGRRRERVERALERLSTRAERLTSGHRARFASLLASLNTLSPLGVLSRGYAIVRDQAGHVIREAREVKAGQPLKVRLHEGELDVTVGSAPRKKKKKKTSPDDDNQGTLL